MKARIPAARQTGAFIELTSLALGLCDSCRQFCVAAIRCALRMPREMLFGHHPCGEFVYAKNLRDLVRTPRTFVDTLFIADPVGRNSHEQHPRIAMRTRRSRNRRRNYRSCSHVRPPPQECRRASLLMAGKWGMAEAKPGRGLWRRHLKFAICANASMKPRRRHRIVSVVSIRSKGPISRMR